MEPDIKQFITQGYMQVELRVEHFLQEIMPVFISMVEDPSQPEWRYDFDRDNEPDTGFYRKDGSRKRLDGTVSDNKAILHYRKQLRPYLNLDRVRLPPDQEFMIEMLDRLYDYLFGEALKIGVQIEEHYPHTRLVEKMIASKDNVIRLLAYLEVVPGSDGIIGKNHLDKDGITFALYESCPGLEGSLRERGPFIPISSAPNRPLVFPGMKLAELTKNEPRPIKPLWHHIRGKKSGNGKKVIRSSAIFFTHPDKVWIDEDKTHGGARY